MPELPKVLYVDDEEINLELLQLTFRNDLKVYTAITEEEGFMILSKNQDIRVVISDLKMPNMGGLELLEHIRSRHESVLTVITTGYGTVETAIEAMKGGAYDFLRKPLSLSEVKLLIDRAVGAE